MSTLGHPATIMPPCAVLSPRREAGLPPMSTVASPCASVSGGELTHTARSPMRAAGAPPMSTVTSPLSTGPPPWSGQVCISPIRAAGCPMTEPLAVDLDQGRLDLDAARRHLNHTGAALQLDAARTRYDDVGAICLERGPSHQGQLLPGLLNSTLPPPFSDPQRTTAE